GAAADLELRLHRFSPRARSGVIADVRASLQLAPGEPGHTELVGVLIHRVQDVAAAAVKNDVPERQSCNGPEVAPMTRDIARVFGPHDEKSIQVRRREGGTSPLEPSLA